MQRARLVPWIIWLIAGIFYLYEFIHRVVISVMVPELMQSFDVSVAAIGGLSAFYFYAYAFAQIPVGLLIDRYNIGRLLAIACYLITIGSLVFAVTSNILLADLCRLAIGLGSAFAFVGCLKLGSLWFPAHKFAFIVGLTNLLGVVGAVIGGKPCADAVDLFGWRAVMLTSAAIGLILTIMLWYIIAEPKTRKHSEKQRNERTAKILRNIITVIKCRQTWLVAAFGGFMVAPVVTYSELWGISFLVKSYQIDRSAAAQITTLTFIGIALGGPVIGWLSDHFRKRKLPMLYGTFGALLTISCIIYGPKFPLWLLQILHFSFGFLTSAMLLCFSLATEAAAVNIRATSIALTNCVIMALGALLQTTSGYFLDFSSNNFYIGFIPLITCYALALICFYFINDTKCKGNYNA